MIVTEEFAYNSALSLLQACAGCMHACLTSLPDAIAVEFGGHLQRVVESEGPMPFVRPFVVDFGSEQEVSSKRQAIEPKLEELCQASRARTAGLRAHRQP